jgi:hypothetical protein
MHRNSILRGGRAGGGVRAYYYCLLLFLPMPANGIERVTGSSAKLAGPQLGSSKGVIRERQSLGPGDEPPCNSPLRGADRMRHRDRLRLRPVQARHQA